jgi:hypothetical protein
MRVCDEYIFSQLYCVWRDFPRYGFVSYVLLFIAWIPCDIFLELGSPPTPPHMRQGHQYVTKQHSLQKTIEFRMNKITYEPPHKLYNLRGPDRGRRRLS